MRFVLSFAAAMFVVVSATGCCCTNRHNLCVNPCNPDPCADVIAGYGHSSWWERKINHWRNRNRCRNHGWGTCGSSCGCDSCGGGMAMDTGCGCGSSGGGYLLGGTSGCSSCDGGCGSGGCGSTGMTYQTNSAPVPTVAPLPPVPSAPGIETPMPHVVPSNPMGNPVTPSPVPEFPMNSMTSPLGQPQQVSYEEFQRLPGTVIQGPTSLQAVPQQMASPVQYQMPH